MTTVLDVGANDGGFASELIENGYRGQIISFEPLAAAWQRLSSRAAATAPTRWSVFPRVALSAVDGEAIFYEAGNSVSSSLLPMSPRHMAAAPVSATKAEHTVRTAKLDSIMHQLSAAPGETYLKIDVQGAEKLVLHGAEESLRSEIAGVQLELSLEELYAGQGSAEETTALLRSCGFVLWDIVPGFRDPETLQLLQYDGVYLKEC